MPPTSYWYAGMQQACADALDLPAEQWQFKSDPHYRDILEHVEHGQGQQVLDALAAEFPSLHQAVLARLPLIAAENDALGHPIQYLYPDVPMRCSPQNMQYVWHALLLLRYLEKLGDRQPSIVEIGGGYGGMALYTYRLADLFGIEIQRYVIVDIPWVLQLQARVCAEWGIPVTLVNGADEKVLKLLFQDGPQFAFSSYGYSEFEPAMRDWYAEHLLSHCDHGLLIWNTYDKWPHIPPNYLYRFIDREFVVIDDHTPEYIGQDIKDVYW